MVVVNPFNVVGLRGGETQDDLDSVSLFHFLLLFGVMKFVSYPCVGAFGHGWGTFGYNSNKKNPENKHFYSVSFIQSHIIIIVLSMHRITLFIGLMAP